MTSKRSKSVPSGLSANVLSEDAPRSQSLERSDSMINKKIVKVKFEDPINIFKNLAAKNKASSLNNSKPVKDVVICRFPASGQNSLDISTQVESFYRIITIT